MQERQNLAAKCILVMYIISPNLVELFQKRRNY